jgi:hypothetical protein
LQDRGKCVPANGDRPHRFTEVLPREEAWNDACELCKRDVGVHEGPHAARRYQFVARGVAETLVAVGAGSTYRDAALVARERAKRLRVGPDGEPRLSRHGSLAMDWVEVFAPVVFEAYRPRAWPVSGSLLLDDLPFKVRDAESGRYRIAFRNFAAMVIRPVARSWGAWRRSRPSRSLTGRHSWALWTEPQRGSCATTTTASPAPCALASRTPSCTCASGTCDPRTTSVGRSIYFKGVLHGTPLPAGGKQLVLEARSPGDKWIEFDTISTGAKGRYHASYRFKFPGPARYQFRVVSKYEAAFPFAEGASNVVGVRER